MYSQLNDASCQILLRAIKRIHIFHKIEFKMLEVIKNNLHLINNRQIRKII
jgi:hypothetical protein